MTDRLLRSFFHHPSVSLPVLRRRTGEFLVEAVAWYGDLLMSRGWSALRQNCFPSQQAYCNARRRLLKKGVLALRESETGEPLLRLSPEADAKRADRLDARRYWRQRWNGIWYVLVYDVPESKRTYRKALQRFLSRMRMGCLQLSVWVSPRDIRPDYADLAEAAGVQTYSHLLEATTVLGRGPQSIVTEAWDFDRLGRLHQHFRNVCTHNLHALAHHRLHSEDIAVMAREELDAYCAILDNDPLLPRALWPAGYCGKEIYDLHKVFVHTAKRHLRQ